MNMKATVITGSPHKNGTSALLADEFIRGAQEAGWETFRFDAAFEQVAPCLGCDRCGIGAAPCVQKDAMQKLMPELLTSQAVALVEGTVQRKIHRGPHPASGNRPAHSGGHAGPDGQQCDPLQ